jgi:hypothetical protein
VLGAMRQAENFREGGWSRKDGKAGAREGGAPTRNLKGPDRAGARRKLPFLDSET